MCIYVVMESQVPYLCKENQELKDNLRKQENQMQQLSKRLGRLLDNKNKSQKQDESVILDQKNRIRNLQSQVRSLEERLRITRQQFGSYTRICPPFLVANKNKGSRILQESKLSKQINVDLEEKMEHLLVEASEENEKLKEKVKTLREQVSAKQEELDFVKQEMNEKDLMYEDEMANFRCQLVSESEDIRKIKLADNIERIKLERESRKSHSLFAVLETQCRTLEENLNSANERIQELELQLSARLDEIKAEEQKNWNLQSQLEEKSNQSETFALREVEAHLSSVQEENIILKESNSSLVAKAMANIDNSKSTESENVFLRTQLTELEGHLKSELETKAELHSILTAEKEKVSSLEKLVQICNEKYEAAENILCDLQTRLDQEESRKQQPCEKCLQLGQDNQQTQWQLVQLRDELNHTKNRLATQMTINKNKQNEIDTLSQKFTKTEKFQCDLFQNVLKTLEDRAKQMLALECKIESMKKTKMLQQHTKNS